MSWIVQKGALIPELESNLSLRSYRIRYILLAIFCKNQKNLTYKEIQKTMVLITLNGLPKYKNILQDINGRSTTPLGAE
jgi:hypothetical protein